MSLLEKMSHTCKVLAPEEADKKIKKGTGSKGSEQRSDELPPLQTQDGALVEDAGSKLRAKGLSSGCGVLVEGQAGILVGVSETGQAKVRFLTEAGQEEKDVPVESVELQKDSKKAKVSRPIDARHPGKDWVVITESMANASILHIAKTALFQWHGSWSPGKEIVRFHEESDGEHLSLNFAQKSGSLVFVPYTSTFLDGSKRARVTEKQVDPRLEQDVPMLLVRKPGVEADPVVFSLKPSDSFFFKLTRESQHQSEDAPTLQFATAKVQVNVSGSAQFCIDKKPIKKSAKLTLEVSFPILTNSEDLPALTVLRGPARGMPSLA